MSSAYLRLLIFLLAILIPACVSSSPAFRLMYSAYKLNKQGDNIQPWHIHFTIWNQSAVLYPVLTVASWHAYRFLKRQVRWSGIPISFMGLKRVRHDWATEMNWNERIQLHNFLILLMRLSPPQINHYCDFKNKIQSRNQNIKYWMTTHSKTATIYNKWNWFFQSLLAKVCIWFIFVKTHCFNEKRRNASSLLGLRLSWVVSPRCTRGTFYIFFTWSSSHCATYCIIFPSLSSAINEVICYVCTYIPTCMYMYTYIYVCVFSCSITAVNILLQL